jgi:N-acetyl-anhydromuramoyl-L-alanine amidase
MRIENGWLTPVARMESPNCDARPSQTLIDLIVIHGISLPPGEFGGSWISDLFMNKLDPRAHPYFASVHDMRVSAHVLVRRDGHVLQYVSFDQRAWHAGQSVYAGRERCNDFSVGIELEGTDTLPYTDAQYMRLVDVLVVLLQQYASLSADRVVGHADIAPGRKTDPGPAFDWARLRRELAMRLFG